MDNASPDRNNLPAAARLRVLKLGGSLLDLPSLRSRLENWLGSVPSKLNLMVVGGGELVEEMRRLDAIHGFESSWIHERCIDLMQHTAVLAQKILELGPLIEQPEELERIASSSLASENVYVVSPTAYREALASSLPKSWSVTSDSIAACLAQRFGGSELVILKSTPLALELASGADFAGWSERGVVDPFFATAAAGLDSVQLVNLRG